MPRDWPCLIIALLLLAYWGRVTRMAWKMRRKTGRAANFIPTEPLGKILRLIWQPVVWAWIGLPLAAAFKSPSHGGDFPLYQVPLLQWIGVAIAVFAFAATLSCWKRMGKSWRMGIDPNEKTTLIFTGPYAYVRHPIYALSSLLMIATVMILPTPIMIGVAVIHILLLQWEARREEQNLSRVHGHPYDQYRARVGRFFPASTRGLFACRLHMSSIPLNIFQRLMRRWDAAHPYNAAQVMKLLGKPDATAWENAWQSALSATGLGSVSLQKSRYEFVSLNGHATAYPVRFPDRTLDDHISIEMNRAFNDPNEPPFRPFIIRREGHFYAGLVYQHWLADSASIRMLMREWFMRVYDPGKASARNLKLAHAGYWKSIGPEHGGWGITQSLLDMTRRHIRMRKVQKIDSTALSDRATQFQLIPAPAGLIDYVRLAAHRRNVKVNDLFLAALAEACGMHVPLQRRRNRKDVAVGSVVDLRPYGPKSLTNTFGLFLGFTNVICQPAELRDFDRLLFGVARQTRLQKKTGVAPSSLMWMGAAMVVGTLSNPAELYHFYRKELPLAGGSSNVDLTHTWAAEYHPAPLLDFIRVSPTGPMTPLVVTTTTLAGQFHLGITHRTGLISTERAAAVAKTFLERLESVK